MESFLNIFLFPCNAFLMGETDEISIEFAKTSLSDAYPKVRKEVA
ncbi:MAG: hypothetical protein ACOC44_16860 [Promethearchaeia archaeon]